MAGKGAYSLDLREASLNFIPLGKTHTKCARVSPYYNLVSPKRDTRQLLE